LSPVTLFALLCHRAAQAAEPEEWLSLAVSNQRSPGSSTSLTGNHTGCQHLSATKDKSGDMATQKYEGVSCNMMPFVFLEGQ